MSDQGDGEEDRFRLLENEFNHSDAEEGHNPEGREWREVLNEICNVEAADDEESDGGGSESCLDSLCSDDEDGEQVSKKSRREFNPRLSLDNFQFKLGMEFPSMVHLRHVLKEVFILNNREYKIVVNDTMRLRAKCNAKG